jgi:hypothetical protein
VADRAVPRQRLALDLGVIRRGLEHGQRAAVLVDQPEVAADAGERRVGSQGLDLSGEAVGLRDVVAIHAGQELAAGEAKGFVERSGEPAIFADRQPHACVARRVVPEDRGRRVLRAVVDHDQLEVAERLAEDAVDGLGEVPLAVVDGHEDGDGGGFAHE